MPADGPPSDSVCADCGRVGDWASMAADESGNPVWLCDACDVWVDGDDE